MECYGCGAALDVGRRKWCSDPCRALHTTQAKYISQRNPIAIRLSSLRTRAAKRGMACTITYDELVILLALPCVYCAATKNIQVDRKNNAIGYILSNVVPACKRCNTVKSMYLTHAQMLVVAKALGWV